MRAILAELEQAAEQAERELRALRERSAGLTPAERLEQVIESACSPAELELESLESLAESAGVEQALVEQALERGRELAEH